MKDFSRALATAIEEEFKEQTAVGGALNGYPVDDTEPETDSEFEDIYIHQLAHRRNGAGTSAAHAAAP